LQPLSKLKNKVFSVAASKRKLGDLLLRERKLTAEQLEIALLMQKRFPLLLGHCWVKYCAILTTFPFRKFKIQLPPRKISVSIACRA